MAWVSFQTKLSYKYRRRTHTVTPSVEESYLRVDVSCSSEACDSCCVGFGVYGAGAGTLTTTVTATGRTPTSSLSADAPYYLIPDDGALSELLELFELPDISNYIILASCLKKVSLKSGRKASRVRALYRDRRRRAVLFDDVHCLDTAAAATGADPSLPPALAAGLYYAQHLGGRMPLVVVSDRLAEWIAATAAAGGVETIRDGQDAEGPPSLHPTSGLGVGVGVVPADSALADNLALAAAEGVTVLSASEYVSRYWPPGSAVSELYDSLTAAKLAAAAVPGDGDAAYTPHLSQQEVEEGLAAGLLMRGVVHVSRRNPREAVVELGHGPDAALGRLVRVSGRAALNRALEGDVVAVRLLVQGGGPLTPSVGNGGIGGAGGGDNSGGGGGDGAGTTAVAEDDPDADITGAAGPAAGGPDGAGSATPGPSGATAVSAADQDADYGAELLADAEGNGPGGEEGPLAMMEAGSSGVLPSAEVVAILQRDVRDIVVCLSQRDEAALKARLEQQHQQATAGGGGGGGGPQKRSEMLVCMPLDRRLPALVVVTRQGHQLVGCRYVVRIDHWERNSRYPRGHVTRVLGRLNDLRAESDAVLVQCGIRPKPFCEAALSELPRVSRPEDWGVPSRERASRRDLTGSEYFVVSIDPVGCTDVDDAMHVRFLPPVSPSPSNRSCRHAPDPEHVEGFPFPTSFHTENDHRNREYDAFGFEGDQRVEVGVHIADVSWFVAGGGMLDGEARDRCTSVYLVDRRLDMLPALLSEQLCSLRQGVERLAVSVIWTLRRRRRKKQQLLQLRSDAFGGGDGVPDTAGKGASTAAAEYNGEYEYDVEDVWYGRTLIRSRHQLHYKQAQDILDGCGPAPGDELPSEHVAVLRRSLRVLDELAAQLHAQRVAAGALELASAELRFKVDPESGAPCQVMCKQKVHMMDVVAEMMIAANSAVAERIARAFPGCALLRNHPPPRPQAFDEVRALIEPHAGGAQIDPASNASLAAALERACAAAAAASDPAAATLIKSLATRAMSEAQYNSSGTMPPGTPLSYHYGLALQYYTHFTSPIRRYADVVVHRQLLAALSGSPPPQLHSDLAAAAAVMNMRHRQAKAAQKECSELHLLLMLHARPHAERALVCGINGSRLELFIPSYHIRAAVALTDRRGLPRPPLRPGQPDGPAAEDDPFLVAERRGLRLTSTSEEASIIDAATGATVWHVRLWQPVSVRLSAADHRAHGPKLALRLLDPLHPDARLTSPQSPAIAIATPTAAPLTPTVQPSSVVGSATTTLPPNLRLLMMAARDKAARDKAFGAGANPALSAGAASGASEVGVPGLGATPMVGNRGTDGGWCVINGRNHEQRRGQTERMEPGMAHGCDDGSDHDSKAILREPDGDGGRGTRAEMEAEREAVLPMPEGAVGPGGDDDDDDDADGSVLGAPAGALVVKAEPGVLVAGSTSVPTRSEAVTVAVASALAGGMEWQLPEFRARLRRVSRLEVRLLACRRGSNLELKLRDRLDELVESIRHLRV